MVIETEEISARSLRRITVLSGVRIRPRSWLFPFFTAGGDVRFVMFVRDDTAEIRLLPFRKGRFVRITGRSYYVRDAAGSDMTAELPRRTIGELHHYDPWWVLGERRYRDHPDALLLKSTNRAERLAAAGVRDVRFDAGLGRVVGVTGDRRGVWSPALVEGPPPPRTPGSRQVWQIAPIWEDPAWRGPRGQIVS